MCDATRSGRPSILTKKKLLDISNRKLQSPKKSIGKLSQPVGLRWHGPYSFKKNPYAYTLTKLQPCMNCQPGDSAKWVAYCKQFLDFLDREREDISDITFFTDKAYFHLLGHNNSQNSRAWCAHNPHAFHKSPLQDGKIGVWVGWNVM
jgi:hypothetical protein